MSLRRHLGGYAAVGALQWGIEYIVMLALSQWVLPVAPANVIGRVCGAAVGFWLNGRWTFTGTEHRMDRRALRRFVLVWLGLTLVNTAAVDLIDHAAGLRAAQALKPAMDVLCAGLGFLLSRQWIYSAR